MDNTEALHGIQEILSKLDTEELLGLAATVTQGLLRNKLQTRAGAIDAILKYSPNIHSILKRKIVTRDVLFEYSHQNNIAVTLPAPKNYLVDVICESWNLKPQTVACNQTPGYAAHQSLDNDATNIHTLALKFSEWFYTMMNSNTPIGSEHFWVDAKLKLNLISSLQVINQDVDQSTEEITQILFKTKLEHNLYFNPNFLSDGIQGRIDPHGLVVVLACGTLHANNACVGTFEQVFMLARDPFSENNWKIKNTELNLKSKEGITKPPSLCDGEITSNLLALPER